MNTTISIATAKTLIVRNVACFAIPTDSLAKVIFKKMWLKKWAAANVKFMIPEGAPKEVKLFYHYKIVSIVEKYNISYSMIVNLDQAPSNLEQSSHSGRKWYRLCRNCWLRWQAIDNSNICGKVRWKILAHVINLSWENNRNYTRCRFPIFLLFKCLSKLFLKFRSVYQNFPENTCSTLRITKKQIT